MRIRVVVAYDFALVSDGVTRALQADTRIEVIAQACSARAAVELAHSLEPDVVLVDLRMPNIGAVAVLDKLCAALADIRVLVMTADQQARTTLDTNAACAAIYLARCSTGDELRQAVISAHASDSITPSLQDDALEERWSCAAGEGSPVRPLQRRELDVLRLVVQRKTDQQIGAELFISPRTVQNHLTQIREKTGLRQRSELTRWAVEHAVG